MRKTLLIIGIIFVIIIASVTTVQASTATATFTPNSTSVKQGDTFTVTLSATCADGINGIYGKEAYDGFGFSYDTAKLDLVSREAIKLADQNEDADAETIALVGSSSSYTSGDVYKFTFKVKANAALGETQISTTELVLESFAATDATVELGTKTATVTIVSNTQSEPTTPSTPVVPGSTTNTNTNNAGDSNTSGNTTNTAGTHNTTNTSKGNTSTTTAGKTDPTTATTILPKTGFVAITGIALIAIVLLSIVMFKKFKKYDGIK